MGAGFATAVIRSPRRCGIGPRLKTALRLVLATLALLLVVGGLGVWRLMHPARQILPLPPELIALDTPEGQALLTGALSADLAPLTAHFVAQETGSFCGVASGIAVLGALGQPAGQPLNQTSFFEGPAGAVRGRYAVMFGGMALEQLAALLEVNGLDAEPIFASDLDLDGLRALLRDNLGREGDALIANFYRPTLGEEGGGHHSPIAAYNLNADRVLVLDTAAYKYPPTWVPAASLLAAMQTPDEASGRSRGLVVARAR